MARVRSTSGKTFLHSYTESLDKTAILCYYPLLTTAVEAVEINCMLNDLYPQWKAIIPSIPRFIFPNLTVNMTRLQMSTAMYHNSAGRYPIVPNL